MKALLLSLPLIILGCSQNDSELQEKKYKQVEITNFSLNQYPHVGQDYEWDPGDWSSNIDPDIFVVIKNQDGAIYYVSDTYSNVDLQDMPITWSWFYMNQNLNYRDQIVFEVYDSDSDENELMGSVTVRPFDISSDNGYASFEITQNQITISGDLIFSE